MMPRPLEIEEPDLSELMRAAIEEGVFSPAFLSGLRDIIDANQT